MRNKSFLGFVKNIFNKKNEILSESEKTEVSEKELFEMNKQKANKYDNLLNNYNFKEYEKEVIYNKIINLNYKIINSDKEKINDLMVLIGELKNNWEQFEKIYELSNFKEDKPEEIMSLEKLEEEHLKDVEKELNKQGYKI